LSFIGTLYECIYRNEEEAKGVEADPRRARNQNSIAEEKDEFTKRETLTLGASRNTPMMMIVIMQKISRQADLEKSRFK